MPVVLHEVKEGDDLSAEQYNEIVRRVQQKILVDDSFMDTAGMTRRRRITAATSQIWIVNTNVVGGTDYAVDLNIGNVLSPYDSFYDPTNAAQNDSYVTMPTLKGRAPTTADVGNFCVLLEDCKVGMQARACIAGPCSARITGAVTPGSLVDVVTSGSDTTLAPNPSGAARVLACRNDSSGFGLININNNISPQIIQGNLAADLVAGSNPDAIAQVTIASAGGDITVNAWNVFCKSGSSGNLCLVFPVYNISSSSGPPTATYYTLLAVLPKSITTYQPLYDGVSSWTSTPQIFWTDSYDPQGSATPYVTGAQAGSDLQRDTTSTLFTLSGPISYGTTVSLYTVVNSGTSGTPTGTVVFYNTGSSVPVATAILSGGTATTSPLTLQAGSYSITSNYQGDASFSPSISSVQNITVTQVTPTVTVTSSGTSTYGNSVTLTATLTFSAGSAPPPTGLVTFKNGSIILGVASRVSTVFGVTSATFVTSKLPAGNPLTINAVYSGDTNFATATGTYSQIVNKAPLTVTANNLTMVYGGAVPTLTAYYGAFVLGDTFATAVTGSPGLTTSATSSSAVASYTITAAVGTLSASNYSFSYVNGSLTVLAAPLKVIANSAVMGAGDNLPGFTVTLVGVVNSDTFTTSAKTNATSSSPPGTYTITPIISGTNLSNYVQTIQTGLLSIS